MTQTVNERWVDFSTRMAKACYADSEQPNLEWILDSLDRIFTEIKDDLSLYTSWDDTEPYPEGHKYYNPKNPTNRPLLLSSLISESIENEIYIIIHRHSTEKESRVLEKLWERRNKDRWLEAYDNLRNQIVERWSSPVHCCLRAGIDVAKSPSAGVVGFVVGDLKKMYPEGIPDWICSRWIDKRTGLIADLNALPDDCDIVL
jgi:hypothetical protein